MLYADNELARLPYELTWLYMLAEPNRLPWSPNVLRIDSSSKRFVRRPRYFPSAADTRPPARPLHVSGIEPVGAAVLSLALLQEMAPRANAMATTQVWKSGGARKDLPRSVKSRDSNERAHPVNMRLLHSASQPRGYAVCEACIPLPTAAS